MYKCILCKEEYSVQIQMHGQFTVSKDGNLSVYPCIGHLILIADKK